MSESNNSSSDGCVLCGRIYEIKKGEKFNFNAFHMQISSHKARKFFISELTKEALTIRSERNQLIVYLSKFNESHAST